ncbi:MAG TPA: alpha/beta hydrolase [Ktedonobacteraceae bacterium]|nr:alpha/beta hydrolase [Ktedonobacteraceae bacterium]
MPLQPHVQAYLEQTMALNLPPISEQTPDQLRQAQRQEMAEYGAPEPVAHVENRTIPGPGGEIPIRIYTPQGSGPFPLLVYFHGGGWVVCDLDTHDGICRSLANRAGCVVVAVDYRLAPEHKFPAAPEDCFAATKWVAANAAAINGDANRIAIGGDSAGGNLTAVITQMARDQGGPSLIFQLMNCPCTDFSMTAPSIERNGAGCGLDKEDMIWFMNHYLNNESERTDPLASPLLAKDLSGLPPALIIVAEYDLLCDEGEQYGQRLKEAGVPVTISCYEGMIHGFIGTPLDLEERGMNECAAALRAAFASKAAV